MSQPAVPTKPLTHMARSHYLRLKALLAAALICVVGLAAATVVLAISNDGRTSPEVSSSPPPITSSDYRGDPYTSGGQTGSESGQTRSGAARCLSHSYTC
jgi:hypothetical protein